MYKSRMKRTDGLTVGKLMGKILHLFRADADSQDSPTSIGAATPESYLAGVYDAHQNYLPQAMNYAESKRAMALAEWQRHNRPC